MQDVHKYKLVSLIQARGGSKRIPRKNIKMMAGKPMLVWTIEASLKSKHVDRTFVSTEDPEIKKIALDCGAEVIDRPAQYAKEVKGKVDYEINGIIMSFKDKLGEMGYQPDFLVQLMPTSPTRTAEQIDEAFELMIKRDCNAIMSVYKLGSYGHTNCADYGYFTINDNNISVYHPECTPKELYVRSLGIEMQTPRYTECPYVYITRYAKPFDCRDIRFTLYVIDRQHGITGDIVDVNSSLDFTVAEWILRERIKREGLCFKGGEKNERGYL